MASNEEQKQDIATNINTETNNQENSYCANLISESLSQLKPSYVIKDNYDKYNKLTEEIYERSILEAKRYYICQLTSAINKAYNYMLRENKKEAVVEFAKYSDFHYSEKTECGEIKFTHSMSKFHYKNSQFENLFSLFQKELEKKKYYLTENNIMGSTPYPFDIRLDTEDPFNKTK